MASRLLSGVSPCCLGAPWLGEARVGADGRVVPQKEKKEKKAKRRDKAPKRKSQTDESEQSEDELDPPKVKKAKSREKQNGDARGESPENARLSSLTLKAARKKQPSNSSETSSGDCDSDQEQVKVITGLLTVIRVAFNSCAMTRLN